MEEYDEQSEVDKYKIASDYFKEAVKFSALIKMFCKKKSVENFQKSPPLQNAVIFCLKLIGTYVELSAKTLGIDLMAKKQPDKPHLFLANLHYLRNRLIHHMDANMARSHTLREPELKLLHEICVTKLGQLDFFLKILGKHGNPSQFDLKGKKYGVFHGVHDLGKLLYTNNPRKNRGKIPQWRYLQGMLNAIRSINVLAPIENMSGEVISHMREKIPIKYYATLNLLDNIAIMGNPNALGGTQLINNDTRAKLFKCNQAIDGWMRKLGKDRNKTIHGGQLLDDEGVAENIIHLRIIHNVLLSEEFGSSLGKALSDQEVKSPKKYITFQASVTKETQKKGVPSEFLNAAKEQSKYKQKSDDKPPSSKEFKK